LLYFYIYIYIHMSTPVSIHTPPRSSSSNSTSNVRRSLRTGVTEQHVLVEHMQRMIDLQYQQQSLQYQQQQQDATTTAAAELVNVGTTTTTTTTTTTNDVLTDGTAIATTFDHSTATTSTTTNATGTSMAVFPNENIHIIRSEETDQERNCMGSIDRDMASMTTTTTLSSLLVSTNNNNNNNHNHNNNNETIPIRMHPACVRDSHDSIRTGAHPVDTGSTSGMTTGVWQYNSYGSLQPSQQQQQQQILSVSSPNISGLLLHPPEEDGFIGRGTLLWRTSSERLLASFRQGSFQSNNSTGTSFNDDEDEDDMFARTKGNSKVHEDANDDDNDDGIGTTTTTTTTTSRLLPTLNKSSQYLQLSSLYGSILPDSNPTNNMTIPISYSNLDVLFQPPPPPPAMQQQQQHRPSLAHPQQHDVHYGNPEPDSPYELSTQQQQQQQTLQDAFQRRYDELEQHAFQKREARNIWGTVAVWCRCIWYPIQKCWFAICTAESLHRSFCYGAIDGMLTGAGIVSTFCGMHLLSTTTNNSPPVRALVVAFTASACFADAVCMAIGHIWTTRVLAEARSNERIQARHQLLHMKADAKGALVDLLLARGMLKIDAMSLADTLEGYPDLFINALTGDALSAGIASIQQQRPQHHPLLESDIIPTTEEEECLLYDTSPGGDRTSHVASYHHRPSPAGHSSSYPSYGRLSEYDMDPDTSTVQSTAAESRKESLFMMLGFSLFAVVPSLIFTLVPAFLFGRDDAAGIHFASILHHVATTTTAAHSSSSSDIITGGSSGSSSAVATAAAINPNTVVISLTAIVMWCLGVWKSRFLDSNWLLFGMETVLVLLICIACAYGLGTILNRIFLPDDYILEVVKHVAMVEATTTTMSDPASSMATTSTHHHETPSTATATQYTHPHHWYLF
jgi:hypothetical protein